MIQDLNNLQKLMLDMVKWFHHFCIENSLNYYMIGGTMLGAARHKGFIPWDDDIDIGMPRKDYKRLLQLGKDLIPGKDRYIIESRFDNNQDFQYAIIKVYDTRTTLIENKKLHPKRGIFIDVFPLDGIGKDEKDALSNFAPIKRRLNLLTLKTCDIRAGRSRIKNFGVELFSKIPDSWIDFQKTMNKIDDLCMQRDFYKSNYVGNLVGMWREKELLPREAFGAPVLYDFEDTELYGVEKADMYLYHIYGNWRQLPPEEKQKSNHDFILMDLNTPYLGGH